MSAIVKTVNLRKVYKIGSEKVVALDCINLEIEKGQVCCILGTSGSGKSTLLNQLAGLEKPTRGEVYIKNEKISSMSEKQLAHFRQRNVGFVFQSYNLLQGMSAIDNVAIPLTFRGMAKKKRIRLAKEMLKAVGLGKRMDHKPSEMSGGQQQRVGIARAFVAKPDVVFADEPTGNLDTRTTREVMNQFLAFAREKQITIILVTHDQNLARYADRIVTIVDGFVVGDKLNQSLYEVTGELRTAVRALCAEENWAELAKQLIANAREHGDGVAVQAFEDCLNELPDKQPCIDAVTARLTDINDRQLFHRIGIEIGYIAKDVPLPMPEDVPKPDTDEVTPKDDTLMLTVMEEADDDLDDPDDDISQDEYAEFDDDDNVSELNLLEGIDCLPEESDDMTADEPDGEPSEPSGEPTGETSDEPDGQQPEEEQNDRIDSTESAEMIETEVTEDK